MERDGSDRAREAVVAALVRIRARSGDEGDFWRWFVTEMSVSRVQGAELRNG